MKSEQGQGEKLQPTAPSIIWMDDDREQIDSYGHYIFLKYPSLPDHERILGCSNESEVLDCLYNGQVLKEARICFLDWGFINGLHEITAEEVIEALRVGNQNISIFILTGYTNISQEAINLVDGYIVKGSERDVISTIREIFVMPRVEHFT